MYVCFHVACIINNVVLLYENTEKDIKKMEKLKGSGESQIFDSISKYEIVKLFPLIPLQRESKEVSQVVVFHYY